MSIDGADSTFLVLKNTSEYVPFNLYDADGELMDADAITLQVFDANETLILQDDLDNGYGDPPAMPTHIEHPGVGQYAFPFGDTSFDENNKTTCATEYAFVWTVTVGSSFPTRYFQTVKVVSIRTMQYLPKLRLIIDKAKKLIDEDPNDPVYVGYTDWMLVQFLEGGLGWVNAFQPYPMWGRVDDFPKAHARVLIDAAVCDALTSQEIFAVDTDINYSDQGNVFVIDHQPKLSAILNATWTRLAGIVPGMKKHYLNNGAIHVQAGPSFRFQTLLDAAPSGSLFRNAFVA